ncbi:hypothetical protein A2V61_02625 [Candidatus Woesebacteria bacterium RBG_19FT_COMBO_47_8]|uniref:Type II secretion system protein GspF domain-containing protein n=1 Tax=Candidatus Woesebacteria bacterium RBG_13_46_13 TaxID=1802479 RepID=A0A1F7X3S2_9BACT|nr:MAG: hypothetical protein A2Y68_03465 [Candidatus Woesebacteria bacterium RBG_13_46_13]OGM18108.1 MAG: hypothetical protein A2V61_02625 [Candidatus Woesebacteria bacterium RBG_19FT_COMBO_47_8]HJX59606.1 type II secretion system F family protein [Patescibacteria group bacterium]
MKKSAPETLAFTKHLATMIKAGVPIAEAFSSLAEQSWSSGFKKTINAIMASINNGNSLAKSLAGHPGYFDQYYISFIQIGEESGTLETSLGYLSTQLYKDFSTRKKIQSALLYPTVVLFTALIIGSAISLFILPKLVDLFGAFDVDLPASTKLLLNIASFMKISGVFAITSVFALIVAFYILIILTPLKSVWGQIVIRLPFVGAIAKNFQITRFCRNLGTLLQSGVPISQALAVTAKTLSNQSFQKLVNQAQAGVEQGKSLTESLSKDRLFPVLVTKMISVGEKSGKLADSLLYLADYYDEELDNVTKNLTTVLEPILLIVVGLIVALIAIAIISPIYQLTGSIR